MCQDALTKAGKNKQIIADTNKMQLTILQDLSSWCLEDLQSRMNRIKIETLVTIQGAPLARLEKLARAL